MANYLDLAGLTAYDKKIKAWIKSGTVDITDDAIRALFVVPTLYEAVDLGLPSGLKWANMNVGAASPEDAGMYFQWGDTVGYTKGQVEEQVKAGEEVFTFDTYWDTNDGGSTFNKYNNNGELTQLESVDDAATVHMGYDWRMPTLVEMQELIDNTAHIFIDLQGNEYTQEDVMYGALYDVDYKIKGIRLIGPNGNSIFIPAAGDGSSNGVYGVSYDGYLWSSSLSENIYFSAGDLCFSGSNGNLIVGDSSGRNYGHSIRGVKA